MKINFTNIGVVRNEITERHAMPVCGVKSEIHINPEYRKALFRIDQQTHLWILAYLHKGKRNVLTAKPRKSKAPGLAKITRGVFSMHSPDRPNPIALTKVKLLARKGLVLYVTGLDVIDGTPVLDIKSFK